MTIPQACPEGIVIVSKASGDACLAETVARCLRMCTFVTRWAFISLLGRAVSVFLCVSAAGAQEGYYGVGHDKWHQGFYSTLKRNDGGGSCCNLMDCRPTQSRMVGDH
jgi:hypothetical protein